MFITRDSMPLFLIIMWIYIREFYGPQNGLKRGFIDVRESSIDL
jgi:hypothetical protein